MKCLAPISIYLFPIAAALSLATSSGFAQESEQQELENPRIVVHENLDEIPDVHVVSDEGVDAEDGTAVEDKPENSQRKPEELRQLHIC